MKELTKDFEIWKEDDPKYVRPFMVAVRDFEATGVSHTLACLTEDEARGVYEFLKQYFE